MINLCHTKSLQVIFVSFLCLVITKGLEGRRTVIASRFHRISVRVGKKRIRFSISFPFFLLLLFFQKRKLIMFKLPQLYSPKTFWSFFFFLQYSNKTQNDTLGQVVLTATKTNTL